MTSTFKLAAETGLIISRASCNSTRTDLQILGRLDATFSEIVKAYILEGAK